MSYYDVLEVDKNATDGDIKRSYRSKSMLYHPDKPNGNEEKFKEINSAYETLRDTNKRKQYDFEQQMLNNPLGMFSQSTGGGMGMPFMKMPTNMNTEGVDELFSSIFGNILNPQGGNMPNIQLFNGRDIPMEEIFSRNPFHKPNIKPEPLVIPLTISIDQSYTGCSIPIIISRLIMISDTEITEEETIYIDIYKGIDNNEIILLKEKGNITDNQIKGDVKVCVTVENNSCFQRNGLDLIFIKKLTLKEALCGFSFVIEHLNSKKLAFNNKSNVTLIKHNYRKTIENMGMSRQNNIGSLIVIFEIAFPDELSSEQIVQLDQIL
jgi:DnaJ family protein B protein 4